MSSRYTVNYYDKDAKLANSMRVDAKTEEMAFVLFCSALSKKDDSVGDFCFMDYDYAQLWLKEWFPNYIGLNIVKS